MQAQVRRRGNPDARPNNWSNRSKTKIVEENCGQNAATKKTPRRPAPRPTDPKSEHPGAVCQERNQPKTRGRKIKSKIAQHKQNPKYEFFIET
jgi:hypothetical protein